MGVRGRTIGALGGVALLFAHAAIAEPTTVELSAAAARFVTGAGAGVSATSGDVDGDGAAELVIGAPGAGTAGERAGAVLVFSAPFTGERGAGDAAARIVGVAGERHLGCAVALSDLDGDGQLDLLVMGDGGTGEGALHLFYGPLADGAHSTVEAAAILRGRDREGLPGARLLGGHDLTGDGLDDVVVHAASAVDERGRLLVIPGRAERYQGEGILEELAALDLTGRGDFGAAVAAEDATADGVTDLWISAPRARGNEGAIPGRVMLLAGPVLRGLTQASSVVVLQGRGKGVDAIGHSLDATGDLDDDGVIDLLIGCPRMSPAGSVLILPGRVRPIADQSRPFKKRVSKAADRVDGVAGVGAPAGARVVGDVDGDGHDDLVVTVTGDAERPAAAYLFHGPVSGAQTLDAATVRYVVGTGTAGGASELLVPGDLTGDGLDDVVLLVADAGEVYLVAGGPRR